MTLATRTSFTHTREGSESLPMATRASSLGESFDSARRSGYRGWFWFPSLDPKYQINQWTRDETNRKINWCYNNLGAVRAAIDGVALDEVDTGLWPKPATASRAFNAKVKHLWQQQCGFHKSFAADGENNFYSAQFLIRKEIGLRGDCFGQKLRIGEASSCPQMHFLPSWQCSSGDDAVGANRWNDGRLDNPLGRALAFRFSTGSDAFGTSTSQDVATQDVVHFHDPLLIGQKRAMSALAPVVRKLFSLDDIERAETSGVLLRTRLAYAIERAEDDDAAPILLPGAKSVETYTDPTTGQTVKVQKIVASDGTEVDVADPGNGRKLKVIESNKTSESASWIKQLLTDVAYARNYPPEYLFALAGLTQGTLVRMAQQKVQRVVNTVRDFQLIMQLIEEWYPFWLWQNIKAGAFCDVRGGVPDEWWRYLVIRPRDMTLDVGREGRLYDDRLAMGRMPSGLYVGMMYGEDEEEFEDEIIRDAYRRRRRNAEIAAEMQEDAIPIDQIFRPPPGQTAPAQPDPAFDPEDPENQVPQPPAE